MTRYARLLLVQFRMSLLLALQYRLDFALNAVMSLFWTAISLVPLLVLFGRRTSVAGWTWPEALLVVGWFTVLKGVLDGAIQPSLAAVVEHVRKGTLDFVLLKPADAQFLVSTTRFEIWRGTPVLGGVALLIYAMRTLGHVPSLGAALATAGLFAGAVAILYSVWILVVALAFFVVKVDNLSYVFSSIYDAARWPASVFRGALGVLFTYVIPLAVMTTYPSLALLDRLEPRRALVALVAASAFALLSRRVWVRALSHYTSAGG